MIPQRFDFPDLYKGDTCQAMHFTLQAVDVNGDLVDIDLTDCVPLIQLRKNDRLFHEFTCTLSTPLEGKFSLLPEVVDIAPGVYDVDVQITHADGTIKTYLRGECTVIQDVSRD